MIAGTSNQDRSPHKVFVNFQEGTSEAFHYYYFKHRAVLLKFCQSRLTNEQAAIDVVSDAFLKLYENRSSIINEKHLYNFLYLVTKSRCMDSLRKQKVKERALIRFSLTIESQYVDPHEEQVIPLGAHQMLLRAIEKLSTKQKIVLIQYYFNHKKTKRIAFEMGSSEQTIRNHLSMAIKQIRAILGLKH